MADRKTILIVDDAEINRSLISDILRQKYNIIEASSGEEALSVVKFGDKEIDLVLLDVIMTGLSGFDVLAELNKKQYLSRIPVIMVSADISIESIDLAYKLGATDYIARPFDANTITKRVYNSLLIHSKQKYLEALVDKQLKEKERNNSYMVDLLSNIIEFRNGEDGLHILNIRRITSILLKYVKTDFPEYNITDNYISLISNAAAMHDIGKISIPGSIINKNGKLTDEEMEIVKTHTIMGYNILDTMPKYIDSKLIKISKEICRWHHERWDGNGYPDMLKGDAIPIAAQIVGLADVYDALTSERIYRPKRSHSEAIRMIQNGECGAFNPKLLDVLMSAGKEIEYEMTKNTTIEIAEAEMGQLAADISILDDNYVSNRTLALLEEERIKNKFFASMTQEIQFEYDIKTKILELSEYGAEYLGIPRILQDPLKLNYANHVPEKYKDLIEKLNALTEDNPTIKYENTIEINGEEQWYKFIIRAIWVSQDEEYTKLIGKLINVHEYQDKLSKIQKRAELDGLTGIYNHITAKRLISETLSERTTEEYMMIYFDMDHFKQANDTYGHKFGDDVLRHVANTVSKTIRATDIFARVGGDEFIVFMQHKNNANMLIDRIFHTACGNFHGFDIRLSMGAALCPIDGTTYEELSSRADKAMYAVKKSTRNGIRFYDHTLDIEGSTKTAIDSNK